MQGLIFGLKDLLQLLPFKRRNEKRHRHYDPALPDPRPRALTLPFPSPVPEPTPARGLSEQITNPQTDSLLVCLPLELRLHIYEAILGNRKVHIAFRSGPVMNDGNGNYLWDWNWWNTICAWNHNHDIFYKHVLKGDRCVFSDAGAVSPWPPSRMGAQKLNFAFLLTCRQVYSEAIDVLYKTTTFAFDDLQVFCIFPVFLLRKRFDLITSIEGVWRSDEPVWSLFGGNNNSRVDYIKETWVWNDVYTILANMPNLSHLRIVIPAYRSRSPAPDTFPKMRLQPLKKIQQKNIKTFEIWVPESYAVHFKVDETSNFKLKTMDDIPRGAFEDRSSLYYRGKRDCGPVGKYLCRLPLRFPEVCPE